MTKNVGGIDRWVRIILGIILILWPFVFGAWNTLGTILFILGIVFLATGAMGTCGLYKPFGISTCKAPAKGK